MLVDLLVLSFNGRRLLAECLPSVLRAAEGADGQRVDPVTRLAGAAPYGPPIQRLAASGGAPPPQDKPVPR